MMATSDPPADEEELVVDADDDDDMLLGSAVGSVDGIPSDCKGDATGTVVEVVTGDAVIIVEGIAVGATVGW